MSEVADYEQKRHGEARLLSSAAIHDVQSNEALPSFVAPAKIRSARKQQLLTLVQEIGREQFRCIRVDRKELAYIRTTLGGLKAQGYLPNDLTMRQRQHGEGMFEVYLIRKEA